MPPETGWLDVTAAWTANLGLTTVGQIQVMAIGRIAQLCVTGPWAAGQIAVVPAAWQPDLQPWHRRASQFYRHGTAFNSVLNFGNALAWSNTLYVSAAVGDSVASAYIWYTLPKFPG